MNRLLAIVSRNTKIYLRDKSAVFFSFLAVLIVFFLYILFLGGNMKSGMESAFLAQGLAVNKKLIDLYADSWMMGGIIGIGCVTIANACMINLVHDSMHNIRNDFFVTPTNKTLIIMSYFFSTTLITFTMNLLMFIIAYGYLLIKGMAVLAFLDILAIIGIIMLSAIAATIFSLLISIFIKTDSAHGAVIAIFTVVAGFATGSYMPLSLFPKTITYICSFYPATHTVTLMRGVMMKPIISEMQTEYPSQSIEKLNQAYNIKLTIGNYTFPSYLLVLYLLATTLIFATVIALVVRKHKRKN